MRGLTLAVARTRCELAAARAALPAPVAVVMTMGALHDGHLALIQAARAQARAVIVTVFVNPLQFGPGEDLDRYPRQLDTDLGLCAGVGADLVFAPSYHAVYPAGPPRVRIDPGPLGARLEGVIRPGHFSGVLTVVAKLAALTGAGVAVFGEKDYQQLILVRRLVRDLDLHFQVVGVPTVREPDGLARSSRNAYLSPAQRRAALALPRALRRGCAAAGRGAAAVRRSAEATLADEPEIRTDYVAVVDDELEPDPPAGPARLLIAGRLGGTRLIDNAPLILGTPAAPALR